MSTHRQHPRRRGLTAFGRRPVVHHAPDPAANVAADLDAPPPVSTWDETQARAAELLADVSRGTVGGPYVAGGQVPGLDLVDLVAEDLAAPPLSPARIAKLEALTAQWVRDVRVGGPGPDDTILYGAPTLPPVPPARRPEPAEATQAAAPVETFADDLRVSRSVLENRPAVPARVSDWTSRHDPRSLEYAVRATLSRPVPVQDLLLPVGPVLDQGTTPPLSVREASACVGMAAAAAANVLAFRNGTDSGLPYDEDDARAAYVLAQDRDHVSGNAYAGTSVLAGMKAGQELGWWGTYLWALGGTRDVAQVLLQLRCAVVLGIPWTAGLEEPDSAGVIRPDGPPAGGHALAAVGLKMKVAGRPGPYFVLQQSRGVTEGLGGLVYLHHTHLSRLLAGRGEAGVPLPAKVRP